NVIEQQGGIGRVEDAGAIKEPLIGNGKSRGTGNAEAGVGADVGGDVGGLAGNDRQALMEVDGSSSDSPVTIDGDLIGCATGGVEEHLALESAIDIIIAGYAG